MFGLALRRQKAYYLRGTRGLASTDRAGGGAGTRTKLCSFRFFFFRSGVSDAMVRQVAEGDPSGGGDNALGRWMKG